VHRHWNIDVVVSIWELSSRYRDLSASEIAQPGLII
jgi:hypothetical protein